MDIRKDIYQDTINKLEEEMTPFGFIDDGNGDDLPERGEDGSLWFKEREREANRWY